MATIDTYVGYTSRDEMFFSSTERSWHTKITKLAKDHPDEVTIIKTPEENDGCIYAKMPVSYLKLQPKREGRKMTDEQREAAIERLRVARENKQNE